MSNVKEIEIPEGKVKQIAKGSEILWSKNGFTLVNAIIGTGTQYIKLGKSIKQNYLFEIEIESTSLTNSSSNKVFGAQLQNSSWPNGMSFLIYKGEDPYFYKNSYAFKDITKAFWASGRQYKIKNTNTSLLIQRIENNSVVETVTVNVGGNLSGTTLETYLFNYNRTDSTEHKNGLFKFKSLKVWDENDVLVMNVVPAIDGSGVPCVVDLVDNRILYNAGTGDFEYE